MLAELTGFQLWVLKLVLPAIIGACLAAGPLIMVISSLRKLLDTLIAANEDGKISNDEFTAICADAKDLKASFVNLLTLFMKTRGTTMKSILMVLICCVLLSGIGGCLWADSGTKLSLNMTAAAIGEINKRCETGDCNACREGLLRATKLTSNIANLANGGRSEVSE